MIFKAYFFLCNFHKEIPHHEPYLRSRIQTNAFETFPFNLLLREVGKNPGQQSKRAAKSTRNFQKAPLIWLIVE